MILVEQLQNANDAVGNDGEKFFHQTIESKKYKLLRSKLMFVGSGRAGKTSLKRRLTGKEFNQEQMTTCGIELDIETWSSEAGITAGQEFKTALAKELAKKIQIRMLEKERDLEIRRKRKRWCDGDKCYSGRSERKVGMMDGCTD